MQDWQTFLKLDNATTIDFLTSCASALSAEGEISEQVVDHFKATLNAVTPKIAQTQHSVLPLLCEYDSEFIEILSIRYGVTGLAWNHLRFTSKTLLSESCAQLASWADLTLKKAELFLNRPFLAHLPTGESRRELFPSVLCHVAKILHDAASELKDAIHALSVMRSAAILDTSGKLFDQENRIALAVGFSGLESETLSYCRTELKTIRKVSLAFDELSSSLLQMMSGISANTSSVAALRLLEAEIEIFAAESQRLSGLRFDISPNLNVWETRRLGLLYELFAINHRMSNVGKLFIDALIPKDQLTDSQLMSSDVERAVTTSLIRNGSSVATAEGAAKSLFEYCKAHATTPSTIIAAELKKINADLREDSLILASTLTSASVTVTPGGIAEKSRFLETAKSIRKALNVIVPFSASMGVLLCVLAASACGVKTMIISDHPDPRPAITFKVIPDASAPEIQNRPKANPTQDKK
jgi:hypothetical protein